MKRYLFVLLVSLCFAFDVSAQTYYSDYGDYSDWFSDKIEESDIISVEKERRYNYYHENIIGDYFIEDENDKKYPLIDKNKYINTDISEWAKDKPDSKKNRVINTRRVYEYSNILPIRYVYIDNIFGGYGSLRFTEIQVFNKGNPLKYEIECNGCNYNFLANVSNGNSRENQSSILNGGNLLIDLNNYYNYDDITVNIYLYDVTSDKKTYNLSLLRNKAETPYLQVKAILYFTSKSIDNPTILSYNHSSMNVIKFQTDEPKISLDKISSDNRTIVKELVQYNYYDIKYYYYFIEREYNDIKTEYYNKIDKSKYKDYYHYKKRDKLVISENNEIINQDETALKFILESTTPVTIEGNIDINTNGNYKIKYITPYVTVEKDILVNISDELKEIVKNKKEIISKINELQTITKQTDNVEDYNKIIEEINNYKIEINRLNIELEDYKNKLKIKDNEKNIMNKESENKIFNLKLEYENKIKAMENKKEPEIKNNVPYLSINFKPILIIFLFFTLVIGVLSYLIKKKKN